MNEAAPFFERNLLHFNKIYMIIFTFECIAESPYMGRSKGKT